MNIDVLYTDKELSMHVYGPSRLCDLTVLRAHADTPSLTADEAKDFFRDGFVRGVGLVSQHHIDEARKYIDSNYAAWIKKSRRQDDWRIHLMLSFDSLESTPVEHAPILDLVLQSPQVLQKLRGLMGCAPCGIFYNQCGYRTPLSLQAQGHQVPLNYTPGAEYHIDGNCNSIGTRFPDPFTILMGVALVDIVTEEKGNFTVFPGSHAGRDWSHYPQEKMSKSLPSLGGGHKVCLAAGDVVFAHCLLPHRGGKNTLTPDDIMAHHTIPIFDEHGVNVIKNIQPGTREMIFFRVRGRGVAYDDARCAKVLSNPWTEHDTVLQLINS